MYTELADLLQVEYSWIVAGIMCGMGDLLQESVAEWGLVVGSEIRMGDSLQESVAEWMTGCKNQ
jgi:hypothetical protein